MTRHFYCIASKIKISEINDHIANREYIENPRTIQHTKKKYTCKECSIYWGWWVKGVDHRFASRIFISGEKNWCATSEKKRMYVRAIEGEKTSMEYQVKCVVRHWKRTSYVMYDRMIKHLDRDLTALIFFFRFFFSVLFRNWIDIKTSFLKSKLISLYPIIFWILLLKNENNA